MWRSPLPKGILEDPHLANDNNQTSYKVYLWPQHDEGERSLLVVCEKAGHGDDSRYSFSLQSQWGCGYCRTICYNRTGSLRLLRYPPGQKFELKHCVHIQHALSELGCCVFAQQCQPPWTGWWVSSQPFEFLTKATRVSGPWFAPTPPLPCSSCPSSCGKDFLENVFFLRIATNTGWIVDVSYALTSELMFSWMFVRWVGW